MPALDQETLDRWRYLVMVDREGLTVGPISEFYLDRETGQPTWALVSTGLFGAKQTFVPLTEATQHGSEIVVPYPKALIRGAPRIEADGQLSPDEEATLFGHYGLDYWGTTGVARPGGTGVFDQEQTGGRQDPDAHGEPPGRGPGSGDPGADVTRSEEEQQAGTEGAPQTKVRLKKYVGTENDTTEAAGTGTDDEREVSGKVRKERVEVDDQDPSRH